MEINTKVDIIEQTLDVLRNTDADKVIEVCQNLDVDYVLEQMDDVRSGWDE